MANSPDVLPALFGFSIRLHLFGSEGGLLRFELRTREFGGGLRFGPVAFAYPSSIWCHRGTDLGSLGRLAEGEWLVPCTCRQTESLWDVDRRKFELDQEIRKRFDSKKLPATIFVVSPLEETGAAIAIDAIATLSEQVKLASERSDHRRLGLTSSNTCFISGQAEKGNGIEEATRNTMASLGKTFDFLETTPSQVQHVKAFIQPMSDAKLARKEIERFFGGGDVPPIVFVEWKSSGLPIEIEMIVTIPRARPAGDDSKITYQTPPHMKSSPVYSRLSLIHSPKVIYTSGLLAEGSAAEQVERTFAELKRILDHHSSDFQHLAKATYYCASDDVSKALNDLRPRFYHPLRPPAASKAMVDPFTESRSTMVIDMILTPK